VLALGQMHGEAAGPTSGSLHLHERLYMWWSVTEITSPLLHKSSLGWLVMASTVARAFLLLVPFKAFFASGRRSPTSPARDICSGIASSACQRCFGKVVGSPPWHSLCTFSCTMHAQCMHTLHWHGLVSATIAFVPFSLLGEQFCKDASSFGHLCVLFCIIRPWAGVCVAVAVASCSLVDHSGVVSRVGCSSARTWRPQGWCQFQHLAARRSIACPRPVKLLAWTSARRALEHPELVAQGYQFACCRLPLVVSSCARA